MVVSTQLPLGVTMAKKPTMDAREAEATARVELFLAIGEFIFEFSQLEFTIRHLLACMLDLKDDKSFDTIVSPYDFRTLCDVTSSYIQDAADCDDDLRTHVKKTFDSCKALNDERVRVAHGTWSIGEAHATSHGKHSRRVSISSRRPSWRKRLEVCKS
jgi:inorganic pyrophosphatase